MIGMIMSGIGAIVSPIAKIFQKKQERKIVREQGEAKANLARVNGETEITLTDQEWEAIQAAKSDTTWKDEYVTVIVTAPIVFLLGGAIYGAVTGDQTVLNGTLKGLQELTNAGLDMGHLMEVVVYAAVGLKLWRKV